MHDWHVLDIGQFSSSYTHVLLITTFRLWTSQEIVNFEYYIEMFLFILGNFLTLEFYS